MLQGGFTPLMLIDRLIEKEALDKAFRIHSSKSDKRGIKSYPQKFRALFLSVYRLLYTNLQFGIRNSKLQTLDSVQVSAV
jgi:hypothetical protein